jgi:hypothetical protein
MLQEGEVHWETDVCGASRDQIGVVGLPLRGIFELVRN